MKQGYKAPEIEIIRLETEQCILSESNTPGFGPGTDLAEFLDQSVLKRLFYSTIYAAALFIYHLQQLR